MIRIGERLLVALAVVACAVGPATAKLAPISEGELEDCLVNAQALFESEDVDRLRALLDSSHLFVQKEAALHLGRLGATGALDRLRELDAQYSLFACAPTGEFGVAVILLENADAAGRKRALLDVATQKSTDGACAPSVINKAGAELSRFSGDDIIEQLADVQTYGAQYTVLSLQCRELTEDEAIAKCVEVLEAHETPQKAEAAERLLVSFGRSAERGVRALKERVEPRVPPEDSTYGISKTILHRSERILSELRAADLEDGFYVVSREAPSMRVVTQDLIEVLIGPARAFEIKRVYLSSTDNWNRSFHLSVEVPYEESLDEGPWHVLVVDDMPYRQTSAGSSHGETSSLGFEISGAEKAKELGEHFSVRPRYRRHPGHHLAVEFVPREAEFASGDSVVVTMRIRNVGESSIAFQQGGRNRAPRDNQYSFSAEHVCDPVIDIGSRCNFGGLSSKRTLKPGETFEDDVELSKWFEFDRSGTYQLLGSYYMCFNEPDDDSWWTIWEDHATAEFIITIGEDHRRDPSAGDGGTPPATGPPGATGEPSESVVDLIKAATTRPWPGESYPVLPALSTEMRGLIGNEIAASQTVRSAYSKLDPASRGNTEWFEGVGELESEGAVWSLASCLCHPHEDVQIHALRALERLAEPRIVPFLLTYAEHMAVFEGGSENATIHGIIHSSVAKTLSAITGVRVDIEGQDPEGLKRGVRRWREWLSERGNEDP